MRFTQFEIESAISDSIPRGLRKQVAAKTHIYESVLYGFLNEHDERKSPQYQTLTIQAALDELDAEAGEKHWRTLDGLRSMNKPIDAGGSSSGINVADALAEKFEKDAALSADVLEVIINGLTVTTAQRLLMAIDGEERLLNQLRRACFKKCGTDEPAIRQYVRDLMGKQKEAA